MAKIADLNVTTITIKDGSITQFCAPYSGALGTNRYIDVVFDAYSTPALIFAVTTAGTANLYYDFGGPNQEQIFSFVGNKCGVVGDSRSAGTATYALSGGTGSITGALMRYR
ncbi:hypothetical protein [Mesorhizobium sp. B2-4-11]|uniref:hypothetical protein n=1 Tax=Mesorhizobium sp. B2-4-11 TaxID=2589938 RepID=UPI001129EF57|nr:hypothetical protein [Mesorhizobium sp. B2-4-11]TPL06696.1 hypothetical protein FJ944_22985 [Mesorhizobium sp. B2-4-11]